MVRQAHQPKPGFSGFRLSPSFARSKAPHKLASPDLTILATSENMQFCAQNGGAYVRQSRSGFEMKNKLSYFLRKAKEEGPVFISNRGKTEFVLQTIEEYEHSKRKEKSLVERIQESRKNFGMENDDFDFSAYYEKIREEIPMNRAPEEHLFDEA